MHERDIPILSTQTNIISFPNIPYSVGLEHGRIIFHILLKCWHRTSMPSQCCFSSLEWKSGLNMSDTVIVVVVLVLLSCLFGPMIKKIKIKTSFFLFSLQKQYLHITALPCVSFQGQDDRFLPSWPFCLYYFTHLLVSFSFLFLFFAYESCLSLQLWRFN